MNWEHDQAVVERDELRRGSRCDHRRRWSLIAISRDAVIERHEDPLDGDTIWRVKV